MRYLKFGAVKKEYWRLSKSIRRVIVNYWKGQILVRRYGKSIVKRKVRIIGYNLKHAAMVSFVLEEITEGKMY